MTLFVARIIDLAHNQHKQNGLDNNVSEVLWHCHNSGIDILQGTKGKYDVRFVSVDTMCVDQHNILYRTHNMHYRPLLYQIIAFHEIK